MGTANDKNHWFSLYLTGKYPKHYRIPNKLLFIDKIEIALDIEDEDLVKMDSEYQFYYSYLNKVEREGEDNYMEFLEEIKIPDELIKEHYINQKTANYKKMGEWFFTHESCQGLINNCNDLGFNKEVVAISNIAHRSCGGFTAEKFAEALQSIYNTGGYEHIRSICRKSGMRSDKFQELLPSVFEEKIKQIPTIYELAQWLGGNSGGCRGIVSIERFIKDWGGRFVKAEELYKIRKRSFTLPCFMYEVFKKLKEVNAVHWLNEIAEKYNFFKEFPQYDRFTNFNISNKKITKKTMSTKKRPPAPRFAEKEVVLVRDKKDFKVLEIKEPTYVKGKWYYIMENTKPVLKVEEKDVITRFQENNENEDEEDE